MSSTCKKYSRLKMLATDNRATVRQLSFIKSHELSCQRCCSEQANTLVAMTALRAASIEPQIDPSFDSKIIRQVRVEQKRATVSYWTPAVAGAIVTGAALLAILQILVTTPVQESIDLKGQEANLGPDIPNFSVESVETDPAE